MKTICAKVLVTMTFHIEDNDDPMEVLNEMDYHFSLENGDPVNSTIIEQSCEEV